MDFSFLTTYRGTTLRLFAWCMFLGLSVAVIAATFQRRVPGRIVRRLLQEQAHSAGEAKTLAELGIAPSFWIRAAMRGKYSAFRRVVAIAGREDTYAEACAGAQTDACTDVRTGALRQTDEPNATARNGKAKRRAAGKKSAADARRANMSTASDYLNGALYIPADCTARAESIFGHDEGGFGTAILGMAVALAISVLITFFAEELLTMLNNFIKRFF